MNHSNIKKEIKMTEGSKRTNTKESTESIKPISNPPCPKGNTVKENQFIEGYNTLEFNKATMNRAVQF